MMEDVVVMWLSLRYWQIPLRMICSTQAFTAGIGCTTLHSDSRPKHRKNSKSTFTKIVTSRSKMWSFAPNSTYSIV